MRKFFILVFISVISIESQELILVTDTWEPFRIEENGVLTGIDIDIIELIQEELGQEIKISKKPWVRCLKDMKNGKADLMIGLAYTEERAKYIDYILIPYFEVRTAFFAKNKEHNIRKYDDLYDKKIGYVNGSSYYEPFDSDILINKVALPRESMLITMLLKNNIDLLIGTWIQVEYELKEKGLSDIINSVDYKPDKTTKLYLGISRKSDMSNRSRDLEVIIKKIIENGSINKIVEKYIDKS